MGISNRLNSGTPRIWVQEKLLFNNSSQEDIQETSQWFWDSVQDIIKDNSPVYMLLEHLDTFYQWYLEWICTLQDDKLIKVWQELLSSFTDNKTTIATTMRLMESHSDMSLCFLEFLFDQIPNNDTYTSINVFPNNFHQPYILQIVDERIKKWSITPKKVVLEIIESEPLTSRSIENIRQLQNKGIKIAIDDLLPHDPTDFKERWDSAKNYAMANLRSLLELGITPDIVKIDGHFMRNTFYTPPWDSIRIILWAEQKAQKLQDFLKEMDELGIFTIIEFIESKEHIEWLRKLWISAGGYQWMKLDRKKLEPNQ